MKPLIPASAPSEPTSLEKTDPDRHKTGPEKYFLKIEADYRTS